MPSNENETKQANKPKNTVKAADKKETAPKTVETAANKNTGNAKEAHGEEDLLSLFGKKQPKKLDLVKGLVIKAGFGSEIQKFGDRWFEAACEFGILRDSTGNDFKMGKEETPEAAAERLASENESFYISDKSGGNFKKYGNDGKGGFEEQPFQTPPRIERPNIILRFLDYCGFEIPSVKAYKEKMEGVKDIPYFYRLHKDNANSFSKEFVKRATAYEAENEKTLEKETDGPEIKKEVPVVNEPEEKKKEEPVVNEPEKNPEEKAPENVNEQKPQNDKTTEKKEAQKIVSLEENGDEVKIVMSDGTVQTFQREPVKEKAPEKEPEKEPESDVSAIDKKIHELELKQKNFPESSTMGLALNEAIENLKNLEYMGLPEDVTSPDYKDQLSAVQKASSSLLLVERIEFLTEDVPEAADELTLGRENSLETLNELKKLAPDEAVGKVLANDPAGKFRKIVTSEKSLLGFDRAITRETEKAPEKEPGAKKENTKNAVSEKDALSIDRKIKELAIKEKDYPASSPMGLAINETITNLYEMKQVGLPEDKSSPEYRQQFSALQKTSASLLLIESMEDLIHKFPDKTKELTVGRENSLKLTKDLQKIASSDAIEKNLGNNPAEKFRNIIENEKALKSFDKAIMKEMTKNPKGNIIPHNAVVYGALYKVPEKDGWQRMPGAKEEDVTASLSSLEKLSDNAPIFKQIEKEKKDFIEQNAKNKENLINERIEHLKKSIAQYEKGSVMNELGTKAISALDNLRKTGMPENPASPKFEKQQQALRQSIYSLCALERAEALKKKYSLDMAKTNSTATASKIFNAYAKNELINNMLKSNRNNFSEILLSKPGKGNALLNEIRQEKKFRENNGIPENAEREGIFFRRASNEPWQRIKNASPEEINNSRLAIIDELRKNAPLINKTIIEKHNLQGEFAAFAN